MISEIVIQQMDVTHLDMVQKACSEIYSRNFHFHWNEDGLEQYIHKVFGRDIIMHELSDKNIQYYLAFIDHEPVAFMKINLLSNLPGLDIQKGLELEKIYILPHLKGMKIGRRLLDISLKIARGSQKEIFWLSVIDTNRDAISFYKKEGFKFHSKAWVDYPKFKDELKGAWRMYIPLNEKRHSLDE